jgi:hypothetical protein
MRPKFGWIASIGQLHGCLRLGGFVASLLMVSGCGGDDSPFYVVDTLRSPVLQLLQKPTGAADGRAGCLRLPTASAGAEETWCQQFPVRPDQGLLLRVVVLAPESTAAIKVVLTEMKQVRNPLASAQPARIGALSERNAKPINLDVFAVQELEGLAKVVTTAPLRLEERFFSLTIPSAESLISELRESGSLPAYSLSYEASAEGVRTDRGFVSFVVLPEPGSPVIDALVDGSLGGEPLSPEARETLVSASRTNTPPQFLSIVPDGGSLGAGSENSIEVALGVDQDPDAKSRIQWFVTSGEMTGSVSSRPKWKPEKSGPGMAFAMVRDLQGGSDFLYRIFEVR